MKLPPREAAAYCRSPDPSKSGLLIYGGDPLRIADLKEKATLALVGPDGKDEMRLVRIESDEVRRHPDSLHVALKSQSFFGGQRVVVVEGASDAIVVAVRAAMEERAAGDAPLILTAGTLRPASKLRKLFEGHSNAYSLAVYPNPPSQQDVSQEIADAGIARASRAAMSDLHALGRSMSPQAFRLLLEKIAVYKSSDGDAELLPKDVEACAPGSSETALDELIQAVADQRSADVGPAIRHLSEQGFNPVTMCIAAQRTFRNIYLVASDPGGPQAGLSRLRPPALGPRREIVLRHARRWGKLGAEHALLELYDTDSALRSEVPVPALAAVERTMMRIALKRT